MPASAPAPSRSPASRRSALTVAITLTVAHLANDAYVAFLHPLLPRLMDKLGLSIAAAAVLSVILSLASSLPQPIMGYLADRVGRRWLVALGPIVSGIFLSLIGLAPSFGVLVALLTLGGLGSAFFHPPAVSLAGRVSEGKGSGLRVSIFSFGGHLGFAIGPITAVAIVGVFTLEGLWVAMFPGILIGLATLAFLPRPVRGRVPVPPPSPRQVLRALGGPLGLVFGISALGAFVQRTLLTLYPIVVDQAGGSEALGAASLSVYLALQAGGTIFAGLLTDRIDRTRLLAGICMLAAPAHFLAVYLPPGGVGAFMALGFAGLLNMAVLPPTVVIAQEILPTGASIGSGIVMGLAWGAGALGVGFVGALGDVVGPQQAALVVMPMFLVGAVLALHPALRPHARSGTSAASRR